MNKANLPKTSITPLYNQKGNTLVGVIAAGVISGLIGLGTYSMISAQIRAQKLVGASSDKTILRAQIQGVLGDLQTCAISLKNSADQVAKYNPDSVLPVNPTQAQRTAYEQENSLSKIALSGMVLSQDGMASGGLFMMKHSLTELDSNLRSSVTVNAIAGKRIVGKLQIDLGRIDSGSTPTMIGSISFPLFMIVNDVTGPNKFQILQCGSIGGPGVPTGGVITTATGPFPAEIVCNDISSNGTWSIVFRFHGVEHFTSGNVIRYRDITSRMIDFNADGSYKSSSSAGSCTGQNIKDLNSTVN